MKNLIFCIPLYLFTLICLFLLLRALYPVIVALFKAVPAKVYSYTLTGYLVISVLYIIIVSFI